MVETPELDKMKKLQDHSQAIGSFLEWLMSEKRLVIAEWVKYDEEDEDSGETLRPVFRGSFGLIEELLAEYYHVDLKKAEAEKQAILAEFRELNKKPIPKR